MKKRKDKKQRQGKHSAFTFIVKLSNQLVQRKENIVLTTFMSHSLSVKMIWVFNYGSNFGLKRCG